MLTKVLALLVFLLIAVAIAKDSEGGSSGSSLVPMQATPTPTPAWPHLDVIGNPPCPLDGAAPPNSSKAKLNRLMNRYHLPETSFEELPLEYLQGDALPQGEISPGGQLINLPDWQNPNNRRAVSVVGFVKDIRIRGCGLPKHGKRISIISPPEPPGVQSANCHRNDLGLCTVQIMLIPDKEWGPKDGHGIYYVKVTRRSRFLRRKGYLQSNVRDWSIESLRSSLKNRRVKFSGWLLFNEHYRERAWASDRNNKVGEANDRQTAWEIHPVMRIEVLPDPAARNRRRR